MTQITSKAATADYVSGWDRIFGKKASTNVNQGTNVKSATEMIQEMFSIQNALNTKSYDKAWIEKGATEEFDYAMAAGDEAHEFARSLPFQWWTKDKADRPNQVTEIVDAWHFVMSQMIIDFSGDFEEAADIATIHYEASHGVTLCSSVQRQTKLFVAMLYMHNGPFHLSTPEHYVISFFKLCRAAEVPVGLLYARYIAKATLNKFRVANGYKQGTYSKIWEIGGEKGEDNFFLARWVDEKISTGHTPTENDVNIFLQGTYAEVVTS